MFEGLNQAFVKNAIARSSENPLDRRRFLRAAGIGTAGVVGVAALGAGVGTAFAGDSPSNQGGDDKKGPSDAAILNFALNLEYLEAEYYLRGVFGKGLNDDQVDGAGKLGDVVGGRKVKFDTKLGYQYALEIADDERHHVDFLRAALGKAKVSRPAINLTDTFNTLAQAAGLGKSFDPFANEDNFLLGAFVFEDVGVTAYKGAAPLISSKAFLEAAAGILAVEAYHAGLIRTLLLAKGLDVPVGKISAARDSLDGPSKDDQGIVDKNGNANIVPTDANGIVFSRTAGSVLNIAYVNPKKVTSGGFFPSGVNGTINTSDNNA